MAALDRDTIERYRRDGVVVVERLLDDVNRQRMKQVLADLIERARNVSTHDDVYDLEPTHSAAEPRVRRIKKPHLVHSVFAEFLRSPRLLEVLSALLGPSGVRLHGSKLNLKSPEYGSPVEWHQDWAFYPHTNDDLLAVGVLLDDATEENGPLLVLPASHRGPTFDHHGPDGHFSGALDPSRDRLEFAAALPLIAPAGSCSFHHVRAVHGSAQNRSPQSRNLLLYEFAAADAFPLLGIPDWDEFNGRLLVGTPTVVPRTVECPIRMPLPPAKNQGSIYENQTALERRYFDQQAASPQALQT
ncbi:MAG: phytanoyl-CoA dioxygenase family protein [Betaproteobacteria bacterium]|nr:phytanoyl-CoA dioxygenase family protein [Betaproteobacteria bacterium]MBA3775447.1 phytanoyl-CoA dioxygenase family protein [Betaproteobacteria bacterium]